MRLGLALSILATSLAVAGCHGGSSTAQPDAGPPLPDAGTGTAPAWTRLDAIAGLPGGSGWVDGSLIAAQFDNPWAIAGDGNGHLFVTDGETIRAIDLVAGRVSTVAGTYQDMGSTDGVGPNATFNSPQGIAFDAGTLYVTDTENHTIRAIDVATATVTTIAGEPGSPGATDGTGAAARFQEPEGLALDGAGNLYIGDTDNNTIRVMSLATRAVTTVAGQANTAGSTDGTGLAARFSKPRALAIDAAAGNLYIADSFNQSVRRMVLATGAVTTLATFGTVVPQGLAVDQGDVLVSLGDDTVVRLHGGAPTVVAGAAGQAGFIDATGAAARFDSPGGLLNDGAGTLYVVDSGNVVVRKMALSSAVVSTFAGARSAGSDDGVGMSARFSAPRALASDGVAVYVADTGNEDIRKVEIATGRTTTIAGSPGVTGDADGTGPSASFDLLAGIAFDAVANVVYVVDGQNRDVRRVDPATGGVTHLTYSYAPGEGPLFTPGGAALDGGHLYVTDFQLSVVRDIDLAKQQISTVAATADAGAEGALAGPQGIAADGKGHLFVADAQSHTVRRIDLSSGTMTVLAGQPFVQGEANGVGAEALFTYPSSVAADALGNVFVADLSNAVRRIDVATGAVTTAVGDLKLGGFLPGPLPGRLTQPGALALTPAGDLLLVSENTIAIAR